MFARKFGLRRVLSFLREERAVASVFFITALPMLLVLAGLGIDSGAAYSEQAVLQNTADTAALAGALKLRSDTFAHVSAQAQSYAALNMPSSQYGIVLQPADVTIGHWDFAHSVYKICGSATSNSALTAYCDNNDQVNAVQVLVRREKGNTTGQAGGNALPIGILTLMGWDHWDVSALAIAAIPANGGVCFLSTTLVDMKNNGSITTNGCNAQFDGQLKGGNNDTATATAGGHIILGPGGSSSGVTLSPSTPLSAPVPNDPYKNTPLPSTTPCNSANVTIDSSHLPAANSNPCYSGNVTINGPVTLPANTYTFNGAQVTISGTVTANSSTFALTGSGTNWATITSQNNDALNITAPTSGTYQGIAIFGNPAGGTNVLITGKNSFNLSIVGVVYMPSGEMDFKNSSFTSTSCLLIDVGTLSVKNNLSISTPDNCSNAGVLAFGHASLVL